VFHYRGDLYGHQRRYFEHISSENLQMLCSDRFLFAVSTFLTQSSVFPVFWQLLFAQHLLRHLARATATKAEVRGVFCANQPAIAVLIIISFRKAGFRQRVSLLLTIGKSPIPYSAQLFGYVSPAMTSNSLDKSIDQRQFIGTDLSL